MGIGFCHALQGETTKAVQSFRKARELGPLSLEDYLSVARLHSNLSEFPTALKWLKDALYHHPRVEEVHGALRETLEKQWRFDAAFGKMQKKIRLSNRDRAFAAFAVAHGDEQAYLDRNPDVAATGLGGFAHWLKHGLPEGRILPGIETRKAKAKPETGWSWRPFTFRGNRLQARTNPVSLQTNVEQKKTSPRTVKPVVRRVKIDIVVPVHNALDDVKKCLHSLQQHTDGFGVRIFVINDGSDTNTTRWLRETCKKNNIFTLIERKRILGYTRAVNIGLRASSAPYVILQNSDTIVSDGWLDGIVRCMSADRKIGIVGPLSNAASWQSVPDLLDDTGRFAINGLPIGLTVPGMAEIVARASALSYPQLPFVNGFCFAIRRKVIDKIGYMDEKAFPVGYGEENDFCIRARDAGFVLAIADDVFVFHAKSKSFGHKKRETLVRQGALSLKRKHSENRIDALVKEIRGCVDLRVVRARINNLIARQIKSVDPLSLRLLFLLPVRVGGGGTHSVVQEASEMRRMGIDAKVAVRQEHLPSFSASYSDIPDAQAMFTVIDLSNPSTAAEGYDIVIGTIFTSMKLVKQICGAYRDILPAYYIQDYEPLFFSPGSTNWQEARDSYTLIPNAFLFAKTQWIINKVKANHDVDVHRVRPSIDHEVYRPRKRKLSAQMRLAAMIRPQTPRRGASRTMRVLSRLHAVHKHAIEIHVFGCAPDRNEFLALQRDFPFIAHGELARTGVADVLGRCDLFIDLSDYQAFGRTALEAMACGCAVAVPREGGADEYARDQINAIVVDTSDENACFQAIDGALQNPDRLIDLQRASLETAARYSVHLAAVSEITRLAEALREHRQRTIAVAQASQTGQANSHAAAKS